MKDTVTDAIQGRLDELNVDLDTDTGEVSIQLFYAVTKDGLKENLEELETVIEEVFNEPLDEDDKTVRRVNVTLKGRLITFYFVQLTK